jgi:L-threonylcarbamoyladenylate synthase
MIAGERITDIGRAADVIRRGGILLSPTDTVWGLMCDFENRSAVEKLFRVKRSRPRPVALLADSMATAEALKVKFNSDSLQLAGTYWPGALTLILLSESDRIHYVCGDNNSLGLRIPDSHFLRKLIGSFGKAIAATSANIAGKEPLKSIDDVPVNIKDNVDCILTMEAALSGQASTVVDCTGESIKLVREGKIEFETIKRLIDGYER